MYFATNPHNWRRQWNDAGEPFEMSQMTDRLPELKICLDTAHLAASGEDAAQFTRQFLPRIIHTHLKDYNEKTRQFCEAGSGNSPLCDMADVLKSLAGGGYEGPLCLELDGPLAPERPALESARMSFGFIRSHLPQSVLPAAAQ